MLMLTVVPDTFQELGFSIAKYIDVLFLYVCFSWYFLSKFSSVCELATINSYFGEGNGSPLQYSCLGNRMDKGSCWASVHGVRKCWIRLSD